MFLAERDGRVVPGAAAVLLGLLGFALYKGLPMVGATRKATNCRCLAHRNVAFNRHS